MDLTLIGIPKRIPIAFTETCFI